MADGVQEDAVRRSIVHTALRLAEQAGSWDALHVHAVARELGMGLDELRRYFGDKDAIAEGFFDVADAALLAVGRQPGWAMLPIAAGYLIAHYLTLVNQGSIWMP